MVNGTVYDYESLTMEISGAGALVGVEEVNYDASREVTLLTDSKGRPRGYSRGKFGGTCSLSITREDYEALAEGVGGAILNHPPANLVCTYANDGQPTYTDRLTVKLNKIEWTQGKEKESMCKLSGILTDIPEFHGRPVWDDQGERTG